MSGYVYFLKLTKCPQNPEFEAIYIGQTGRNDIGQRMFEHAHSVKGYTAKFKHKQLLMVFETDHPVALERFFKNHRSLVRNLAYWGPIEEWKPGKLKTQNMNILKQFPFNFRIANEINIQEINQKYFGGQDHE